MMISISKGRKILATIWIIGSLIPIALLTLQTIFGTYYNGKEAEAWTWFAPVIAPTLGLILSVIAADASNPKAKDRPVGAFYFWVAFVFSGFYLLVVNVIFFSGPFVENPLDLFKRASLALAVAQGFVTVTLGMFFSKESAQPGEQQDEAGGDGK